MSMEDLSHTADGAAPKFIEILRDLCDRMELDHAGLGVFLPEADKLHAFATYPEAFVRHYRENALHEIDPTLDCARKSVIPCDLSRLKDHSGYVPIFVECARFGIPENGMCFPVHGPDGSWGVFNVLKNCTDSEWRRLIARKAPSLHFFGLHLFESACASIRGSFPPAFDALPARLCNREIDMLRHIAAGLQPLQIARKLGISPRIVDQHLKGAIMKMQALNPEHAAARAQGLGLL